MKYALWVEGYAATGQSSRAEYLGTFEGVDFKDAVRAMKFTIGDNTVDIENCTWWGCRIFDNEEDARRSFG